MSLTAARPRPTFTAFPFKHECACDNSEYAHAFAKRQEKNRGLCEQQPSGAERPRSGGWPQMAWLDHILTGKRGYAPIRKIAGGFSQRRSERQMDFEPDFPVISDKAL